MSAAPLLGLVLAGGRSTRMQRDKASLEYRGKTQLVRAMELLAPQVLRAYVSVRPEQLGDPDRAVYDTIADLAADLGPIGGIQAALRAHPDHAWLVLACDLPFLDAATLSHLIARRAGTRLATAYRSGRDALPEPLCAIYEPASHAPIDAWIESGQRCPRAWLRCSDVELLDLPEQHALDNINTAAEYAAATARLGLTTSDPATMPPASVQPVLPLSLRRLEVRYFALLREQAGRSSEAVQTAARTPEELYAELRTRHRLQLDPAFLRVAVNDEFGDWHQALADGDTVVFLPPVAGG